MSEDEEKEIMSAYMAFMKCISEMDYTQFRKVRAEFEGAEERNGYFHVSFLDHPLDITKYLVLEDCINMRHGYHINEGIDTRHSYLKRIGRELPQDNRPRPHVRFPWLFIKARNSFKELYHDEYIAKGGWITELNEEQLHGFDLWIKQDKEKESSNQEINE